MCQVLRHVEVQKALVADTCWVEVSEGFDSLMWLHHHVSPVSLSQHLAQTSS